MSDTAWNNRIVDTGVEDPNQLLANPKNWRIHPKHQQRVLGSVLGQVGWVQDVIVNRTTNYVLDGHLRVAMAISNDEVSIPVSYVELSDAEEDLVLAGLDPLSGLAVADPEALDQIMAADSEGELQALFDPDPEPDSNGNGSGYVATADLLGGDGSVESEDGNPGFNYTVMCPECGEEFVVFVPE